MLCNKGVWWSHQDTKKHTSQVKLKLYSILWNDLFIEREFLEQNRIILSLAFTPLILQWWWDSDGNHDYDVIQSCDLWKGVVTVLMDGRWVGRNWQRIYAAIWVRKRRVLSFLCLAERKMIENLTVDDDTWRYNFIFRSKTKAKYVYRHRYV